MSEQALPPTAQEQEVSVLGAVLVGGDGRAQLATLTGEAGLRAEHFYRQRHGLIFAAMVGLSDRNEPIDAATVTAELERRGLLEEAGGTAYVHSLPTLVPAAANYRAYAKWVIEAARLRRYMDIGRELAEAAAAGDFDAIAKAEGRLAEPAAGDRRRPTIEQRQHALMEHLERGTVDLPQWPWTQLNEMTGGIWPGQLTILGGVTSHGKSVVLDQVLELAARRNPKLRIAAYLNEMSALERDLRFVSRQADISFKRLMLAKLFEGELPKWVRALEKLPFEIVPAAGMSARDIAREIHRHGWQLLGLDLLNGLPGSSRTEDIDENVRTLATVAAESGCHIIACNHLNRNRIVGAYPPEPALGDLRGSGQIADLAHNVMFVYRYEQLVQRAGVDTPSGKPGDDAYIDLAKVRNGILGRMDLVFEGGRMRFLEPAQSRMAQAAA